MTRIYEKHAKYLQKCKEATWNRWSREYIRSLQEQHRRAGRSQMRHLTNETNVGDAVIIKSEQKIRNRWVLAIVTDLIKGRDGITRAAKLRVGSSNIERAIQCPTPRSFGGFVRQ